MIQLLCFGPRIHDHLRMYEYDLYMWPFDFHRTNGLTLPGADVCLQRLYRMKSFSLFGFSPSTFVTFLLFLLHGGERSCIDGFLSMQMLIIVIQDVLFLVKCDPRKHSLIISFLISIKFHARNDV